MPRSIYPHGAEQDLYAHLARWIDDWFAFLRKSIEALPEVRSDEGETLSEQFAAQIAATRQALSVFSRRNVQREIERIMDAARSTWGQVDPAPVLRQVAQVVQRTVNRNFARQMDATKKRVPTITLQVGQDLFGEYQDVIDRYTREASLLIKDIGDKAARDIERAVQEAVAKGTRTQGLSKQIEGILSEIMQDEKDKVKKRAALIARDQIGKLNGNLTKARHQAAGINRYEWQTAGDSRVRPEHAELDGTIRTYGKGLEPGQAIRCRCTAIPIID